MIMQELMPFGICIHYISGGGCSHFKPKQKCVKRLRRNENGTKWLKAAGCAYYTVARKMPVGEK